MIHRYAVKGRALFFSSLIVVLVAFTTVLVPGGALGSGSVTTVPVASDWIMQDRVTKEIFYIIDRFIAEDQLERAVEQGFLDETAKQSWKNSAHLLAQIIRTTDDDFSHVPGYLSYKKKILHNMRHFIGCFDFKESLRLIKRAEKLEELEKYRKSLDELDDEVARELVNLPLSTDLYRQWIKQKYAFDKKVDSPENSLYKAKHKIFAGALKLKRSYLRSLALLKSLSDKDSIIDVDSFQDDTLGLTLENALKLVQSDQEPRVKNNSEQIDSCQAPKSGSTLFNSLAHTLQCTLYELEAACAARFHGKKIVAFGPTLKLIFEPKTQTNLLEKIYSYPYLKPTLVSNACILEQEFDVVTDDAIIECKNLHSSGVHDYMDEFLRQQFMVTYALKAIEQKINVGSSDNLNVEQLAHKPIVCYYRYMRNFLQEEKKYRERLHRRQPIEDRLTLDSAALDDQQLSSAELTEIRELVARTDKKNCYHEGELAQKGISSWNGSRYHHVLKVMHAYQMPTIAEISKLKKHIEMVGQENFDLHIIAPQKLHEHIQHRFNSFGIHREAVKRLSGHRRSYSAVNIVSTLNTLSTSTAEQTDDKENDYLERFGALHFLRKPLLLKVFNFCVPGERNFTSPKKSKTSESRTSPCNHTRMMRRLFMSARQGNSIQPRNLEEAFEKVASGQGD